MSLIEADGLSVVHRTPAGEVTALAEASLSIDAGELIVLIGRSGSGKTTLLHALGGIERPSTGRVRIDGTDITGLGDAALDRLRQQAFGFVFQSFGLISALSAAENVELPLRIACTAPAERDEEVARLLRRVGLADHARQRPDELSGGQQQRVGIARALAGRPRILLADEPTGQLDSVTALGILELFRAVADSGVAVLIATHDPALVERADRVLEMHSGRLQAAG